MKAYEAEKKLGNVFKKARKVIEDFDSKLYSSKKESDKLIEKKENAVKAIYWLESQILNHAKELQCYIACLKEIESKAKISHE